MVAPTSPTLSAAGDAYAAGRNAAMIPGYRFVRDQAHRGQGKVLVIYGSTHFGGLQQSNPTPARIRSRILNGAGG